VSDPLAFLDAIMQRCGAHCSPAEFHAAVNVVFHEFESEVYDDIHQDMWTSLPPLFALFAEDCVRAGGLPEEIAMLDIGCGTGLASDSILKSCLGPRIRSIDLLDTSPKMLARALQRSKGWSAAATPIEGIVDSLPAGRRYDLIVTCSVLHHVPDIPAFLNSVARLQPGPGFFIHIQDPNRESVNDPEAARRAALISSNALPEWAARLSPKRVLARLSREISGQQGKDYISKANQELIRRRIVTKPLTTTELFSITDIHTHVDEGISVDDIKPWMPGYRLTSRHSYGFFGALKSMLPARLQSEEDRLLAEGALNGVHIGAAWKRSL
jgi:ubiquinone/menaquinone biosynthesis C-methylase UbiE